MIKEDVKTGVTASGQRWYGNPPPAGHKDTHANLRAATSKIDPEKWYVYDLDTHKVIGKGYDTSLHADNSPEKVSATKGHLVVKQGKDLKEDISIPQPEVAKSQSEVEIGNNNTIVLTSPSFSDGSDQDKISALNLWTSLISSIRGIKAAVSSKTNLLNIIQALKTELSCLENELTKIEKPADAAITPYQAQPEPAVPAPPPTPSLSITGAQGMTTAEEMQHLAGIWPKSKLIESKKKVYITLEAWEKGLREMWPDAVKSTAYSSSIRYIFNEEYVAEFNMRQRNGFIKIRLAEDKNEDEENLNEGIDVAKIDVDSIHPDQKDHDRAEGLQFKGSTFHGNNAPWGSEASKMAKLIKDPLKLVRRAKAVVKMYGTKPQDFHNEDPKHTDVWTPFHDALEKMGFSREQIEKISKSK